MLVTFVFYCLFGDCHSPEGLRNDVKWFFRDKL